ncbi:AsnC family transcriptional regulator [Pseudomaricurvus alkylphenolicus]|uniref:Lrp/AsnC family transcriptional regulator n=1 Tax=Pseudomaricurvus alkylphenolicus TaxID=1306991 RepID=UPI001420196D|nr:AsnC family transcriptional regulator [Pseudomaricurvus alkylphenolicus]NIB38408.1 AsnC family transcriptional regulator [Pseudomaricurvus alkylphenolicus]
MSKKASQPRDQYSIDDIDKEIIRQLRGDGRMSYRILGQNVGLSEAAVRQRVNRLRENNIFTISVVVNQEAFGINSSATIGINAQGDLRKVARKLADIPETEYVNITAGKFDIIVDVLAADNKELSRIIIEEIKPIKEITEISTNIIMENYKIAYGAGPS